MSQDVENRVVSMEFDNSKFESNAQQSMKTLDQLNSKINDSTSAKGLQELGKAANNVNLDGLAKSVDTVNHRFSTLGIMGVTAIANLTNTAVNFGKRLVMSIPTQIIQGGWKRALNIEQAKFQIEGLKGIWDETSKGFKEGAATVKQSVLDAVNGTAYGLDEAAKVASQFMASGMKAGKEMTTSLKGIAGTAAMTSSSFDDIGRIFTTIAGNGRVMTEQLNQFSSRGLNAAATLTEYLNKTPDALRRVMKAGLNGTMAKKVQEFGKATHITEQQLRTLVSGGAIDFKTFSRAMSDAFGEHAKEANETYTGSLSNMRAALSRIGADLQAQKLENYKRLFNALTPLIDKVHTALAPLIATMNKGSKNRTDFMVKGINKVTEMLGKATDGSNKASKGLEKIASSTKKTTSAMRKELGGTKKILSSSKKEASSALNIFGVMKNVFGSVKNILVGLGRVASAFAKSIGKLLAPAAKKVASAFSRMSVLLKGGTGDFKKKSTEFADSITKAFDKKIIPSFSKAGTKFNEFKNSIAKSATSNKSLQSIGKSTATIFGKIGVTLKTLALNIAKLMKNVSQSNGVKRLKKELGELAQILKKLGGHALSAVATQFEKLAKISVRLKPMDLMANILSKIAGAVAGLFAVLRGANPLEALVSFAKGGKDAFDKLTGVFDKKGLTNNLKDLSAESAYAADGTKRTAVVVEKSGDSIADTLRNILERVKETFETIGKSYGVSRLKKFFKNMIDSTSELGIKDVVKLLADLSKAYSLFKFAKGFSETNGKIVQSVSTTLGSLTNLFNSMGGYINKSIALKQKAHKFEAFKLIAVSLAAVIASVAVLAMLPMKKAIVGLTGAAIIMGLMVAVMHIVTNSNVDSKKLITASAAFAALGVSVALISVSAKLISGIDGGKLIKATLGIFTFIAMMTAASRLAGGVRAGSFIALGVGVAALVGSVWVLSKMKPETVVKGGVAVFLLMSELALAARLAAANKGGAAALIGLSAGVAMLAPAIVMLSLLPFKRALKAVVAISLLMTSMGVAVRIAGKNMASLTAIAAMAGMMVSVATAFTVLSFIKAGKLITVASTLSAAILAIGYAGKLAGKNMKGILLISAFFAALVGALYVMDKIGINPSIKMAQSIAFLATALAASVVAFSMINPTAAVEALKSFSIFLAGVTAIVTALGALSKKFKGFGGLIEEGGDILEKIGNAIGKFVGGVVGGVMAGASSGLPAVASNLTAFMTNIKGFVDGAKGIDESTTTGIKNLSDAILALTKTEFINGLAPLRVTIGKFMFASQMQMFVTEFKKFASEAAGISDDHIEAAKKVAKAAKAMVDLAGSVPPSGVLDKLLGYKDIGKFGYDINNFIVSFKSFAASAIGITDEHVVAIKNVAKAGKAMASLAESIPSIGALQLLTGFKSLGMFGFDIKTLVGQFTTAANSAMGITDEHIAALSRVGKATRAIANIANTLPTGGGLWQGIAGGQSIGQFATEIKTLVEKFASMSEPLSKVDAGTSDKLIILSKGISALSRINIPKTGGLLSKVGITGSKDLGSFGKQVAVMAQHISGISADVVAKTQMVATATRNIANAFNVKISKDAGVNLGKKVREFSAEIEKIDPDVISGKATGIANAMKSVARALNQKSKFKSSGVSSIKGYVSGLRTGSSGAASAAKAVSSKAAAAIKGTGKFSKHGKSQAEAYAKGLKSPKGAASAGKTLSKSAYNGVKTYGPSKFRSVGEAAGIGFANGLSATKGRVRSAGWGLGDIAYRAAKDAIKSKSPSKKFRQLGVWSGQGMVIGVQSYYGKVYDTSRKLGLSAVSGARFGIGEAGKPRITPVLDLSEVEAGARGVQTLFNGTDLNASFTASAVSNQNGNPMQEIVDRVNRLDSAIDRLNETMQSSVKPDMIYQAVRQGASDATISAPLDGRELVRGLAKRGVVVRK